MWNMLLPLIGMGVGAVGGALGGRKQTSAANSTPTLRPELRGLDTDVSTHLRTRINDPGSGMESQRQHMLAGVNQGFQGSSTRIAEALASRGMGQSGTMGKLMAQNEWQRAGAIGNAEQAWTQLIQSRQDDALRMALQQIGMGTGNNNSQTTSNGSAWGNALGSASSSMGTMMMLRGLGMFGGGSSGGIGSGI